MLPASEVISTVQTACDAHWARSAALDIVGMFMVPGENAQVPAWVVRASRGCLDRSHPARVCLVAVLPDLGGTLRARGTNHAEIPRRWKRITCRP